MEENGLIFITVPNIDSGNARRQGKEWGHLQPQVHLQHFTLKTLCALLDKTGFDLLKSFKTGGTGLLGTKSACPASLKTFAIRQAGNLSCIRKPIKYILSHWLGRDDFITVIGKRR